MRFILALLVLSCLAVACLAISQDEAKFQDFMKAHKKSYSGNRYTARLNIFKNNLKRAAELQARSPNAVFGVTKFSDLTTEEFIAKYLNSNITHHDDDEDDKPGKGKGRKWDPSTVQIVQGAQGADGTETYESSDENLPLVGTTTYPTSFNWSTRGAVTPVYNQGQCGSCWAFSATESVESQWKISGRTLTKLSMKQLVDCSTVDLGCNGGNPINAYNYLIKAGGQESYTTYPYTTTVGTCKAASPFTAKITGWQRVTTTRDEAAIKAFTYSTGPPSVLVDATIWQTYKSGIITPSSGCGTSLNHAVQLTGWKRYPDGKVAWVVRNSWGTTWGEKGYIYLQYGYDVCGIGAQVTAAII